MYRLIIFGAQVQCEKPADVMALVKAAEKTFIATAQRKKRLRPSLEDSSVGRTTETGLPTNEELYNTKSG